MKQRTVEEKLIAIIQHAIDNGFDLCGYLSKANAEKWKECVHQWQNVVDLEFWYMGHKRVLSAETILFDHLFAKSFFGNVPECESTCRDKDDTSDHKCIRNWQRHLQALVLQPDHENRVNYCENHLPKRG